MVHQNNTQGFKGIAHFATIYLLIIDEHLLQINASVNTILDLFHAKARDIYNISSNLRQVCDEIRLGTSEQTTSIYEGIKME
jgi:hypothetical protein